MSEKARSGTPADAVEGVTPRFVAEPDSAEAVSSILQWASQEKLSVLVRGAGTKLGWGRAPRSLDVLISTAKLDKLIAHRHGDLTATVQAGASLASVNGLLARHRQWIPLDPPWADRATIGGLVATNDSGPRRHRYGAPRDLIIGVELARADGVVAKGGGIVVKNVAGYDLPRLMTGSFGALGVILTATFKLYPLTETSRTVVARCSRTAELGALAGRLLASQLTPTAVEFATHPLRLLIRFESIAASVEQQSQAAAAMMMEAGLDATILAGDDEDRLWNELQSVAADESRALVKVSVLPSELPATLDAIGRLAGPERHAAAGRAGAGVFLLSLSGDSEFQKRVVEGLRQMLPAGKGSAVVVRGSASLKNQLDVWGPIGDSLPLMQAVKQQFDPAGLLSPGRGPV